MTKHSNYRIAFEHDADWHVTKWAILPLGYEGYQQMRDLGLSCDQSLRDAPERAVCTGHAMQLPERALYLLRDYIWPQDAIDALVGYVLERREAEA